MKAKRKPLVDEVWRNLAEDEEGYEPMPEWLRSILTDTTAQPGQTFRFDSPKFGYRIVQVGDYIVKGPTDTYPVKPDGFDASYDIVPEGPTLAAEHQESKGQLR